MLQMKMDTEEMHLEGMLQMCMKTGGAKLTTCSKCRWRLGGAKLEDILQIRVERDEHQGHSPNIDGDLRGKADHMLQMRVETREAKDQEQSSNVDGNI